MFAGQLAQPLQERLRRHDIAAFALDRLDDDGGDLVGRDEVHQDLIADERDRGFARTSSALPLKR